MHVLSRFFPLLFTILFALPFAGCATVGQNAPGIENFAQVSPTLYRGAQPTDDGIRALAAMKIKTVLNLRDAVDAHEQQVVEEAGMKYVHIPLLAEKVTPEDADRILALLPTLPQPIFVHCHAGRDRTGMVVAAYRISVQGWQQKEALRDLRDHGHYWAIFPKVSAAVTHLTPAPRIETPAGASAQPAISTAQTAAGEPRASAAVVTPVASVITPAVPAVAPRN